MRINTLLILLVLAFFGLLFYSIRQEEQRAVDRRLQSLPNILERRHQERRGKSLASYFKWAIRSLWSGTRG